MEDGDDHGPGGTRFRLVLLAVGVLQGIGFYLLVENQPWETHSALFMAATAFLIAGPATFQLCFGLGPPQRAAGAAFGLALPLALLGWWFDHRIAVVGTRGFDDHRAVFFGALPIILYVLWPYLQSWTESGRRRFPYAPLFRFAWSNILIAAVALAFLGVFWLVLWLWGALFGLVGVDFFKDLFGESEFVWPFSGGVFALGVAIARENGRLVPVLRRVVLMLFQVLAPVLAAVSLLFLAFLPFTGLEPLWGTKSATAVLVCLMFALTLFTNAVVQDGGHGMPFGRWMGWLMAATLLALPVFAAIAIYAIRLRIDQYGLTPERFIAQLIVLVAALHVLAYALGVVLKRRDWSTWIVRVNPWLAPVVALIGVLLLTPLADPYARSAAAQLERLRSGEASVEEFDYALLKFRLGQPGLAALAEVRSLVRDHPQGAVIAARLEAVESADSYWMAQPGRETPLPELDGFRAVAVVRPEGSLLPDEVLRVLHAEARWEFDSCVKEQQMCGVLQIDMDRDGNPEYLFLFDRAGREGRDRRARPAALTTRLAYRGDEGWSVGAERMPDRRGAAPDATGIDPWDAFVSGDIELVEPEYYDIRIGRNRLHF
jgi:hypothetical protein